MSSTAPGTARMARMLQNTACRPGNRSLASAYPARLSRNTRPSVMNVATMMLLVSHRPNGMPAFSVKPKIRFQADSVDRVRDRATASCSPRPRRS